MIADWLPLGAHGQAPPDGAAEWALATPDASVTWTEFANQIATYVKQHANLAGQRVGLQMAPTAESLALFFSLVEVGAHIYLMAANAPKNSIAEWANDFGLATVFDRRQKSLPGGSQPNPATTPSITILTSGTTGKPKAVEHTWQSLIRPVRKTDAARGTKWLLTFRPHLYAGLQVILQCLINRGTLAMPNEDSDAEAVAQLAARTGVEFASATPSYWRWLLTLAGEKLGSIPLRQITLGGEAVDQATLDALRATFPNARLVHIYATTELGRCFSVTDGLAGFPSRFLQEVSADGVEMRIEDGELVVRSANAMSGYDGDSTHAPQSKWFPTSDLVEVVDDRVTFVGRMTDMINVGGNKVYPVEVETLIRSIPGVADARVYGEASSMVGELVKCDIVVQAGFEPANVEAEIRKRTLAELTNYQRPRFISIVEEIPRTAAGKVKR